MGTNSPFLVLSSYGILHLRKLLEKQTILGKVDIWNKLFFFRFYLFIFRERGKEGGRKGEKHQLVASLTVPQPGTIPATQALSGNQTSDFSLCGIMPHQLSHAGQG